MVELFQGGDNNLNSCEFGKVYVYVFLCSYLYLHQSLVLVGAEQCILVRDEKTKRDVLKACNNNALVLTALESKGMEFSDILMYNYFQTSDLANNWRLIYHCLSASKESRPVFDPQKHVALCAELKLLYVLVTRTRQRLLIFDSDSKSRKPMLDYWCERSLVTVQPLDDNIKSMFANNSTPEEWREKALQFYERKQYENAKFCFEKAGDDRNKQLCYAVRAYRINDNPAAFYYFVVYAYIYL